MPTILRTLLVAMMAWISISPGVLADVRMDIEHKIEKFFKEEEMFSLSQNVTYLFGDERISYKSEGWTIIMRFDWKKMFVLNHQKESYQIFDLPLNIEGNLPLDLAPQVERFREMYSPIVEVGEPAKATEMVGWQASKVDVAVTSIVFGMSVEAEFWISKEVPVDLLLYSKGARNRPSVDYAAKLWRDEVGDLGGVPVFQKIVTRKPNFREVEVATLTSAVETEVPAAEYEVPAGYREEPADYSMYVPISRKQP